MADEKHADTLSVHESPDSKTVVVSERSVENEHFPNVDATFYGQTAALFRKHMLVFKRSWGWTFFRSSLLPVAFIVFMVSSE